jgi:hypothetical protein
MATSRFHSAGARIGQLWLRLPTLLVAAVLSSCALPASSTDTPPPPTGLMCELMEHPEQTVITDARPEFGWIYNPSARGDSQAGFQLIVASSIAQAEAGTGDMWDSGPRNSGASINIEYDGAPLAPSARYYWRVRTRDQTGRWSSYSTTQGFAMDARLNSASDFKADTNGLQWVWYPETPVDGVRWFRKNLVIPAGRKVQAAQFLLTCDNQFTLSVNGATVGTSTNWKAFTLLDISQLVPGTNVLAVRAVNVGVTAAGLTGKLQYRLDDDTTNTVFIDGSWRTATAAPSGWDLPGFDDRTWVAAQVIGNYGSSPWNTTATLPPSGGLIYGASTNPYASRYPLRFTAHSPVLVTNTAPGRWFVDFGQDAFGYVTLRLNGAFVGQTLEVRFGEMASNWMVRTNPPGTIRYGTTKVALKNGDTVFEIRPPDKSGSGVDIRPLAGVVLPFRYAEFINCPAPISRESVTQQRLQYEFNDSAAAFDSSSTALNQVWALCQYSMKATSFAGVYVDGDRERLPYEADAYINQLSHYSVDREYTLARYSHEYLLAHPTWPTEWKFHSVLIAWADYEWTGNTEVLFAHYDTLKTKLFPDRVRAADGLLQGFVTKTGTSPGNQDIVDWPAGERDGFVFKDYSTVINAFYYRSLRLMARIADVTGHPSDAADYTAAADRVYDSFNAVFWNAADQRYVDGEGTTHASAHANFTPLAFGLVPADKRSAVVSFLRTRAMAPSVYAAQYLLEGLYESGEADYALSLMTTNGPRGWLNMIAAGSTITTEAWDFSYKPNQDWNHAWGAAPGNIIPRYALGLRPLEPGFGKVLVQPQLGSLSFIEGTVPTIRGPIFIRADRDTNNFKLRLHLPGNVSATVMLPAAGLSEPVALVDGDVVSGTLTNGWLILEGITAGHHALWLSATNRPSQQVLYDNWRSGWFGADAENDAIAGPQADPDHDGSSNYAEFIANTCPQDGLSRFQIEKVTLNRSTDLLRTTVWGKAGRRYELQRADARLENWTGVDDSGNLASDEIISLSDLEADADSAFYRVRVIRP